MGLGLADGFLAGFRTMDDFQRGQKADARAEKEMGLRDAMWNNTLDRQKVSDDRYKSETDYAHGRDGVADTRYTEEKKFRENQANISNGIAQKHLGLAQAQNNRADAAFKLQQDAANRQLWLSDNMPTIQVALSKYQNAQPLSDQEKAVLNSPYASRFNPAKVFGDPDFHASAKTAIKHIAGIAQNPEAPTWDAPTLANKINTPEMTKAMGLILKPQLDAGIGTKTPLGTVKAYNNPRFLPTGRGTFVLEADVDYVDDKGNHTTSAAPVTDGRGGDGKAVVKEFTPQQLINHIGEAAKGSNEWQINKDQWNTWAQANGLQEGADWKGYRSAVVKIGADTQKNISAIQRDTMTDDAAKSAAIKAEREAADAQVLGLQDVYSLPKDKSDSNSQEGGADLTKQVSNWVGGDSGKQGFLGKLISKQGETAVQALITNGQLDAAYQDWQKKSANAAQEQKASELLGQIRKERSGAGVTNPAIAQWGVASIK